MPEEHTLRSYAQLVELKTHRDISNDDFNELLSEVPNRHELANQFQQIQEQIENDFHAHVEAVNSTKSQYKDVAEKAILSMENDDCKREALKDFCSQMNNQDDTIRKAANSKQMKSVATKLAPFVRDVAVQVLISQMNKRR